MPKVYKKAVWLEEESWNKIVDILDDEVLRIQDRRDGAIGGSAAWYDFDSEMKFIEELSRCILKEDEEDETTEGCDFNREKMMDRKEDKCCQEFIKMTDPEVQRRGDEVRKLRRRKALDLIIELRHGGSWMDGGSLSNDDVVVLLEEALEILK